MTARPPGGSKKGPSGGEKPIGILPGQYFDAETGLNYNYFRDYSPRLGRYIQADPIGLRGGFNVFAYVDNNPGSWFDPFGLDRLINPQPAGPNGPRITFQNDDPSGPNVNLPVSDATADMIENVVRNTGLSININSTRGGTHDPKSRHYQGRAIDINKINCKSVSDRSIIDLVRQIQEAFNADVNIRENFGPITNTKKMSEGNFITVNNVAKKHKNHLHISGQR